MTSPAASAGISESSRRSSLLTRAPAARNISMESRLHGVKHLVIHRGPTRTCREAVPARFAPLVQAPHHWHSTVLKRCPQKLPLCDIFHTRQDDALQIHFPRPIIEAPQECVKTCAPAATVSHQDDWRVQVTGNLRRGPGRIFL